MQERVSQAPAAVTQDGLPQVALARAQLLGLALAQGGGVIAYAPFLTLLLPARVTALAGRDDVAWLGAMTFAGAVASSLGGVLFGWLSDRSGGRRGWVVAGLALSAALQMATAWAPDPRWMLALVVGWQLALNMMLVPMMAWAGDVLPPRQQGRFGAMLAFAPALGAVSGVVVTALAPGAYLGELGLVALLSSGACLPLLLGRLSGKVTRGHGHLPPQRRFAKRGMWLGRLLVQIGVAGLTGYVYFWLRGIDPAMGDVDKALCLAAGLVLSIVLAALAGHHADRTGRARKMLALLSLGAAAALIIMAAVSKPLAAKLAYVFYAGTSSAFLALHGSQMLRVLPNPARRGRDLGLFNLANTVPALLMPVLAVPLVSRLGYAPFFLLLAGLAAGAAIIVWLSMTPAPSQGRARNPDLFP